jgi:hypothetical protein
LITYLYHVMRKFLFAGIVSALSIVCAGAATTPVYINNSPFFAPPALPPQIDATAFANRSIFDVSTASIGFIFIIGEQPFAFGQNVAPYQMMNTVFVTNGPGAIIRGSPGFRFDFFSSSDNARIALDTFENRGSISASPLIRVMATNIFNRGPLEVTDVGLIRLQGTNVDLRRSSLLAGSSASSLPPFGGGITGTNHFNAPGVNDIYWGAGINNRLTNGGPPMRIDTLNSTNFTTPPHQVMRLLGAGLFTNLVTLPGFTPFVYTNAIDDDELQVQIVYMLTNSSDPLLSADVRFIPGASPNDGADAIVAIESRDFDILTGTEVINGIYLVDHSAFTTNIGVTWNGPNVLGQRRTRRPDTYELFRVKPVTWDSPLATSGNADITNITFYSTNTVSNTVVMAYAAYSATFAGPAFTNITVIGGGPPIPPPGRVEIFGDHVSLDRTRIKAETTVTIRARDLASNAVAQVDAPILELDLASTSPPLVIRNLTPPTVRRLSGQIQAWSGVWDMVERDPVDTNITFTTQFHVLVVNPFATAETTVSITELFLAAEQITMADQLNVNRAFRIDARDWTIADTGFLSLPTGYALGASNVLNLVNFTNFGIISMFGNAVLGLEEGVDLLENYVIAPGGSFAASGHQIGAQNVQIAGSVSASAGGITVLADSVNLSGNLSARSDIDIRASTVSAANSFITAGAAAGFGVPGSPASLIFDVVDSFTDAGIAEPNDWTAYGGIQVLTLPSTGDLLGTSVRIPLDPFGEALVLWPSADFGASAAGFENNLALGTLVLDGGTFSLVRFEGVQEPGAIYINRLELFGEQAADPLFAIEIDPDMTVYFADSNVDPTTLDGLHGGRLQWVPDFAGPLNSTNIVYPSGESYTFNTALIRSTTLDSDGDGIVNALDSTPVIVGDRIDLKIACSRSTGTRKTVISWMAPANSTSVVEYKDSLHATTWQSLPAVQNTGAAQRLSISDDLPAATASQRFYRVRTEQP